MLISHRAVKIKSGLKSNQFDFLFRNSVLVENESKLLSLSYENNQAYQRGDLVYLFKGYIPHSHSLNHAIKRKNIFLLILNRLLINLLQIERS